VTPVGPAEFLVEESAVAWFGTIGYALELGSDVREGSEASEPFEQVLIPHRLASAAGRLNSELGGQAIAEALRILSHPPHPTLIENNRWFHTLLTDGVEVDFKDPHTGETRGGRARLIDFDSPAANDFLVVRQLAVQGTSGKFIRLDLVVYVNGLPLALIELKDPTNPDADLWAAVEQFGRYKQTAPDLFVPNVLLVASDGLLTRVGSITSDRSRFMPWRPAEGGQPTLEALIRGLFEPAAFLDYIRSCVVFEEDERGNIAKKIAGYHQFRAERKARARVVTALKPRPV